VLGIANGNSIAAGCARAFSGAGEQAPERQLRFAPGGGR
jgi:hypothetical protein